MLQGKAKGPLIHTNTKSKMSSPGTQDIPRFARDRLRNPFLFDEIATALRASKRLHQIAALTSVACNDNAKTFNTFVLAISYSLTLAISARDNIFIYSAAWPKG
jgi:transposase